MEARALSTLISLPGKAFYGHYRHWKKHWIVERTFAFWLMTIKKWISLIDRFLIFFYEACIFYHLGVDITQKKYILLESYLH